MRRGREREDCWKGGWMALEGAGESPSEVGTQMSFLRFAIDVVVASAETGLVGSGSDVGG